MKSTKKLILCSALCVWMFSLNACYLSSSIVTAVPEPSSSTDPGKPNVITNASSFSGLVSAGKGYSTTPGNFRVRQSTGLLHNKQLSSTPNGFKIYNHVSGKISAQEMVQ